MNYYTEKTIHLTFEEAIQKVSEQLKKEGFGILTDIDITKTLKEKLNIEFRKYKILGACNPPLAYEALQKEANIGLMLPCNVVVQETTDNNIRVSVINPLESMKAVDNQSLMDVAQQVSQKLKNVLDQL